LAASAWFLVPDVTVDGQEATIAGFLHNCKAVDSTGSRLEAL